jgi:hypothetical protein
LGLLEGLLVNLWRGRSAVGTAARGLVARAYKSIAAALPARAVGLRLVTALVTIVLAAGAAPAYGSEASKILEKCGHGEPFGGYSQKAYREALKQMTTTGIEYSPCESLIRKAEEASVGGGTGATAGTPASNVALPLTPAERRAVQSAHRSGSAPVQVGGEPVRPGIVHADIASAVNTLPHSLFAVLAFMVAGALVLAIGEVRKRVRSRRDG